MFRKIALIAASTLLLGLGAAHAQDFTLPPSNGQIKLASGFAPDPYTVSVQAGGPVDASAAGEDCRGFIPNAPHLRLFFSAGESPLQFTAASEEGRDLTMVVRAPDGTVLCDDDSGPDVDPAVTLITPASGQYDIWVGVYSGDPATATLSISGTVPVIDPGLPGLQEVTLTSGFVPDPQTFDVIAGGTLDIGTLGDVGGDSCYGYTTAAPALSITYTAGAFPLYLYATSDDYVTILVRDPDGNWICGASDFGDPVVAISAPTSGQYDVWMVGYEGGEVPATLGITEVEPVQPMLDGNLPGGTTLTLTGGFVPDPQLLEVIGGGDIDMRTVPELGDSACWGVSTAAPTVTLNYTTAGFPLYIYATTEGEDLVNLVIRTPDGSWICASSDFGQPVATFDPSTTGEYDIWVLAGDGIAPAVTLGITEVEPDLPALDPDLDALFGTVTLAAGFTPDPTTADVTAGGDVNIFTIEALYDTACWGYTTEAPTLTLEYAGGAPVYVYSVGDETPTGVVVHDPNGNWLCGVDETYGDGFVMLDGTAGTYDIWVVADYQNPATVGFTAESPAVPVNWDLDPLFGQTDLAVGFPQPLTVPIQVGGGTIRAGDVDDACRGFVTEAPTYRVYYDGAPGTLVFAVTAETDTTMLIADPVGDWICDDDSGGDRNPMLALPGEEGVYDVWIGTYSQIETPADATLTITEGPADPDAAYLDWTLPPLVAEVTLGAGFVPDPVTFDVTAGGPIQASRGADDSCRGYVNAASHVRINFTAGEAPLAIWAMSDTDATLVISDPNGNWLCDDDSGAGANPAILIQSPVSGPYDIWVGTYSGNTTAAATLLVSGTVNPIEDALPVPSVPPPVTSLPVPPITSLPVPPVTSLVLPPVTSLGLVGAGIDPTAAPVFGEATMTTGFNPDPTTVTIDAGGPIAAFSVSELVGVDNCRGNITAAPTYRVTYTAGPWPLFVSAFSEADLTLVIRAPDGTYSCNDDTVQSNPVVQFPTPASGQYDIWVGTYDAGPVQAGTLRLSELGGGP